MKYIRRTAEAVGYIAITIIVATLIFSYVNSDDRKSKAAGYESAADQKADSEKYPLQVLPMKS